MTRLYTGPEARALRELEEASPHGKTPLSRLICNLAATVEALEAERGALRRQVDELTALGVSLHKAAAAGRDAERAAVVAWLRRVAAEMPDRSFVSASSMRAAATRIERGEHVAEEDR